jgi:hypothetical protein
VSLGPYGEISTTEGSVLDFQELLSVDSSAIPECVVIAFYARKKKDDRWTICFLRSSGSIAIYDGFEAVMGGDLEGLRKILVRKMQASLSEKERAALKSLFSSSSRVKELPELWDEVACQDRVFNADPSDGFHLYSEALRRSLEEEVEKVALELINERYS